MAMMGVKGLKVCYC